MRKIIIFIIICLLLGASLLFCVAKNKNISDKTVVQFASWGSESEINILKPILKDFEIQNPNIKIDFMHIPQNYFQKIHLLFASNTSPDVIFINNQYLPIYAQAKVLEDLTPYKSYFDFDKFYKKSIESMTWNNKIYAVPRDISNLVIFYNKEIFDKYNVPYPKSDWTLNEFLNITKKLTHRPELFGISYEDNPLFLLPYLTSNGGWTKDDTQNYFNKNVLNNKNNKIGLEFYESLGKKYHVAPLKYESASSTMAQLFLQEHLAMHLSGRWLVPKYRSEAKFDWDVINFPNGKNGSIVPTDSSGWAISKYSKHKKEAVKLIQYLSSEKSLTEFTKSGLIVPARINIGESKAFLDNTKPKNSKIFLDIIEKSTPTPVTINYREILDDLKNKTEYIFNE